MSTFTILLAGDVEPTARLGDQIAGSRVIAADSGMRHAAPLGLEPELWVGDFDSADDALLAAHSAVPRQSFPADKAKTDGELAIDEALARGATRLILVGGFGGRNDHALAHVQLVLRLARPGLEAMVTSGREEGYPLVPGDRVVELAAPARFSIVPFSDLVDLTLSGVSWPLTNRFVPLGSTLTISNEAAGSFRISLGAGIGLLLIEP